MIKGDFAKYILNSQMLSRVSKDEEQLLEPFLKASDSSGLFRFHVGVNRFQKFYYRILPTLLENPMVDVSDNCFLEA